VVGGSAVAIGEIEALVDVGTVTRLTFGRRAWRRAPGRR
jgi:hypothetical protein